MPRSRTNASRIKAEDARDFVVLPYLGIYQLAYSSSAWYALLDAYADSQSSEKGEILREMCALLAIARVHKCLPEDLVCAKSVSQAGSRP